MSVINSFFEFAGTWFGYVGSCVASPNGTCVPFIAFIALGAAACAALALVLLAYRSARARELRDSRARRESLSLGQSRDKLRAKVTHQPDRRTPRNPWHAAA